MRSTASVSFAPVDRSDADALVAIRIRAMRESLERIGRFDPVRARERFLSGFSPEHTCHILVDGIRAGFVVVKPQDDNLLLDHLYLDLQFQNMGVGTEVLSRVFAEADAERRAVRVGALRGSDANRFYVRHGFQLVKEDTWDNYYIRPAALPRQR